MLVDIVYGICSTYRHLDDCLKRWRVGEELLVVEMEGVLERLKVALVEFCVRFGLLEAWRRWCT